MTSYDTPPLRHAPDDRLRAMREPLLGRLESPQRRRTRPTLVLAGAAALAAVVMTFFLAAPRTDPALAVQVGPDVIELRITDAETSSGAMTAALQDAGVRGYVVVVPAVPELVGKWVRWGETASLRPLSRCLDRAHADPVVTRLNAIEADGGTLRVPTEAVRESSGAFYFVAGRAPRAGESPVTRDHRVDFEALPPEALPEELRALLVMPPPTSDCP